MIASIQYIHHYLAFYTSPWAAPSQEAILGSLGNFIALDLHALTLRVFARIIRKAFDNNHTPSVISPRGAWKGTR